MWNFMSALAKVSFAARAARTHRTKKQLADPPRTSVHSVHIIDDESHAVHVHHIILSFAPILTEQEKKNLSFLRYLIEVGKVNEEG